ncbi:MAG: oligosaccharide flippase family protein [Oribacterium sp.]|nr:oligosaccharide flippase family protein [Oribacterium sp.]
MNDRYCHILRTMFITFMAFAVNYGINLVLTPYITETVGVEAYGFVTLARQFVQYAMIATSAIDSFAARYIAISYHSKNIKRAEEYFSSVFFADLIVSGAIAIVSLLADIFLDRLLHISAALIWDVKTLFFFVIINFFVSTIFTVFGSAAYVVDRLDITGIFKGISYLAELLSLVLLYAVFPARVYYIGIGMLTATMIIALSNLAITLKYIPSVKIHRAAVSLSAVYKLFLAGVWNSVNALGGLLNNGLDLIIGNLMLTPLAMGQIAIAKMILTACESLNIMAAMPFQPQFLKKYAEKDMRGLMKDLKLSMKISGFMGNLAFAGFAALGITFYQLWIPSQDISTIYVLTLISLLTLIPGGSMRPLYYIYVLTIKNRLPSMITIAGGVANVLGMYFLIKYTGLGVYSVVWTTVVVMFVINFGTNPLYMAHVLKQPLFTFYPNLFRNVISCCVMTIVFCQMERIIKPDGILSLVISALLMSLVGLVIHVLIVFDRDEWKQMWQYVVKHFDI